MADIRFKISGTSSPFVADIYRSDDPTRLICSKTVGYSGIETLGRENYTCVIFSSLKESTSYDVKLTDSVGRTKSILSLPPTPVSPVVVPIVKNVELLGYGYAYPTTLCTKVWQPESQPDGKGGKCIRITPELETGECVRINLCAWTDLESDSDTAIVKVYKRTSPTASYSLVEEVDDDTCNFTLDIGVAETVCYASCVILAEHSSGGPYYAQTCLEIINNVTSVGSALINSFTCGPKTKLDLDATCSVATTTTTTSNTPYKVYFSRPLVGTTTCKPSKTAKLTTDPPLLMGGSQSFRVHFYLETHYEHLGDLESYLCECSRIYTSSVNVDAVATDSRKDTSVNITKNCSFSRVMDWSNIGDTTFSVCSIDCLSNDTVNHSTYSCLCICKIDQAVGGSYSFGGTMPAFGVQGIDVSTDVFVPYVPPGKFDRFDPPEFPIPV